MLSPNNSLEQFNESIVVIENYYKRMWKSFNFVFSKLILAKPKHNINSFVASSNIPLFQGATSN
jgi:hypothetical protein